MNFDDYANHIFQKYRLAIAFAIVRNTPDNLTPKIYLENLKKHIASKMESFDPDVTICEDDFNFDDNDEFVNNDKIGTITDRNDFNNTQFNDSVTILKDFDFDEMMRYRNNDNDGTQNNSVSDVLRILKDVNNEELEVALGNDGLNLNNTQSTYYESSQNGTQTSTSAINDDIQSKTHTKFSSDRNINIPKCSSQQEINSAPSDDATFYDSQKTVLYTLQGFTEFTHVSQSQVDNIVIPKYLINKVSTDNKNLKTSGLEVDNQNNFNDLNSKQTEYKRNYKVGIENNSFSEIIDENSKQNEISKVINKASKGNKNTIAFDSGLKASIEDNNVNKRDVKHGLLNKKSKIGSKNTNFSKCHERNTKQIDFSKCTKIEADNNKFSKYSEKDSKQNKFCNNSKIKDDNIEFNKYSDHDYKQNELSENLKVGISSANLSKNNERDFIQNKFNKDQINKHMIDKDLTNSQDSRLNKLNKNKNCSQIEEIKETNQTNNTKHKYVNNTENIEAKRTKYENSISTESDLAYFDEIRSKFNMQDSFTDFDIDLNNNSALGVKETMKNESTHTNMNVKEFEKYETCNTLNFKNNRLSNFDSQNSQKTDKDGIITNFGNESQNSNINAEEFENYINSITMNFENQTLDHFDSQKSRKSDLDEKINNFSNESQNFTQFSTNENNPYDKTQNVYDIDQEEFEITDSQAEVVPFKVLEELSRIKAFLNKNNRRKSTDGLDSGYKSDSQTRNTFKSALQSTNTWLNQSAHSLLTYIARCPLTNKIADITNEISRTLGQLIDRLHEEEKYPSFLEEHLEKVEELLKDIYENDTSDNILLKKDENIHRLFLLNRSSHIIKYTVGKILAILENAHTKITSDEIFEINSVHEIENLSYIFHILEILLKRMLIFKNVSSQTSTQSSQDEGILKKSSLTDIWRKKWNAKSSKFESDVNDGYTKQCVLDQCGDILNKIIVQAMDGYSLISFYALQCFNLLQN